MTWLVTLSHLDSSFDRLLSHILSSSNTLFSLFVLRIHFLVSSTEILVVLPAVDTDTYLISLYPLKYCDTSPTRSLMTSVRTPTGPSMTNVVRLLSSHGNSSNQTRGASKNIESMKKTRGKNMASRRRSVCSRKFLRVRLYHSIQLCMILVRSDASLLASFVLPIRSSSRSSRSSAVAYSRVVSLSTYVVDLRTNRR